MKICVLTTSFPRFDGDDAGVFVQRLVKAFSNIGVESLVIAPLDNIEPRDEKLDGYTIKRFRYSFLFSGKLAFGAGIIPNLRKNPLLIFQAPFLLLGFSIQGLKESGYSVVHANWLITAMPGSVLSLFRRAPLVVTARGEDIRLLKNRLVKALLYLPLKRASYITVVSESGAMELKKLLPFFAHKIVTISNGVDLQTPTLKEKDRVINERKLSPDKKYLIYVGSLVPRKRIEVLIELVKDLGRSDLTLLLCGRFEDEYVKKLKSLAVELGVIDQVRFEGVVPVHEVPVFLACSSIYITASEHEGRPNALLEAMSLGLPVAASNIPAHNELIRDGENGFLFDDRYKAVKIIDDLLGSNEKCQRLASAARESVKLMSWEKCAGEYAQVFNTLI